MKRKLSLLLALVMILSLVPMSAFAASDNKVVSVPKVADDYEFTLADAPELKIIEKDGDFDTETFRMKLENAEWLDAIEGIAFTGLQSIEKLTATTVEATIYSDGNANTDDIFRFPMLVEMTGKGDAKVTVDPRDSAVTGGTYTFAIGAGGDTVATIEDTTTFTDVVTLEDIEIEETNIGAIGAMSTSKIKLKLPSDFEWDANMIAYLQDANPNNGDVVFKGGFPAAPSVNGVKIPDDRTLEIYVTAGKTTGARGSIFLKGLTFTAKSDADYGDVTLDISGDDISSTDLLVAKYADYDVTIKADGDPEELVSGRMASSYNDDAHKLQTLVIKEEVDNAWLTERKTRVEFPSWVKILGADVTGDTENITTTIVDGEFTDQGDNYVEFTGTQTAGKKAKLYVKFFVSVKAGETGDIVATVSGRSLPVSETEVVLGKAINPVSVEAKGGDVRTGIKGQEIGDITITENKKEAIKTGTLKVVLGDGLEWSTTPTVKVVEGTLDIDEEGIDTDNGLLTIPVKSDSSKPAKIVISGVKVDLDRTIPEGKVEVKVKGLPVVENDADGKTKGDVNVSDLDEGYFDSDTSAKGTVATVITPADANTKARAEVKFVIGSATYKVGDEEKTADVAPMIDANGRTLLPLRYVAEAMGVSESNIVWNNDSRTVVIIKGDRVVSVKIDSNVLTVNGTEIPMDTAAVIKDGRTMLPIRFIAQALGAEVAWDAATQTVTIK